MFAVTRPGDESAQAFARELGAVWAGGSDEAPPEPLDAAIVFAPDGALVPVALRALAPGGHRRLRRDPHERRSRPSTTTCSGASACVRSVANLTRRDGEEFLALAPRVPVRTRVTRYPLEAADEALADLRAGRFTGAAVLVP